MCALCLCPTHSTAKKPPQKNDKGRDEKTEECERFESPRWIEQTSALDVRAASSQLIRRPRRHQACPCKEWKTE